VLWEETLGELDLSCEAGYIVTSLDLGFPAVREVVFEMAYTNGTWDETGFYASSAVSIGLGLDGAKAPVQVLLDRIRSFVMPNRRPRLRYMPNGYTTYREMVLRGQDCQAVFDNPRVMACVASFVCPSGRAYEYLPDSPNGMRCVLFSFDEPGGRTYNRTYNWSYPLGLTSAVNVINEGNANSPWTLTIFGPVVAPIVDFMYLGVTFSLSFNRLGQFSLGPDEWVEVNSEQRTAVKQDGTSVYANMTSAVLPFLRPGQTTLHARAADTMDETCRVEFCYRSAWI